MKTEPILENAYARIDIVDLEQDAFIKTASVYLLGSVASEVKTLSDLSTKNKSLVSSINVNAIKRLIENDAVVGGADEWEELEDIDFDELLNGEPELVEKQPSKKSNVKGDVFSDMVFYTKDKASDIREKVALATGIKPHKQYLWFPKYKKSLTNDEVSLMTYWKTSIRSIEGYPIDSRRVFPLSNTPPTIGSFADDNVVIITCVNLDSIVHNKSKLELIARTDTESFELIHMNLIERFFPLMTLPVFNQYLSDESQIPTRFESYEFDKKVILAKYKKLSEFIPELNKQPKISVDKPDLFTISTTDLVIAKTQQDRMRRIDTLKLFQLIDTNANQNIASVDLYRYDEERKPIRLRKLQQRDEFRISKDEGIICSKFHSRKQLIQSHSLVIRLLPRKEYDGITILIEENGSVWIRMLPNQSYTFTKLAFLEFISGTIDPIIKMLNDMDPIFMTHDRFMLIKEPAGMLYNIVSSSSKISFMFSVSYKKLLDTVIDKLLATGLLKPLDLEWNKKQRSTTSFEIMYGVSNSSCQNIPFIDIKDISGVAVILLSNLDVEETDLYADIIGRLILSKRSGLELESNKTTDLSTVDPLLFRPRVSADGYSRVCQKKYQPVISDKSDKSAVEYYNFTFNRPEYYKCPSSTAPQLGFITGKHPQGYCLPCCRKLTQPNFEQVQKSCIENNYEEKAVNSTYKIDYPILDIPNSKIMDRRITLPKYICRILGLQNVVANGSILSTHKSVRDGMYEDTKSFLQTALILSCLQRSNETDPYKSYREFILDIIAMIKHPTNHVRIMKNQIVADRYTSPQALVHAIEDKFIKMTVFEPNKQLSAIQWNDLIIFLANCMSMNVLLLSDDRLPNQGIQMMNFHDINPSKPIFILLKRLNVEWSMKSHNTRALYFPITENSFKVFHKSQLIFKYMDLSKSLTKLHNVLNGANYKIINKQFSEKNIKSFLDQSKSYNLYDDLLGQQVAIIKTGRSQFLCTVFSVETIINPTNISIQPTATLEAVCNFILDYNENTIDLHKNIKNEMTSYKLYLEAVLKLSNVYQFIDLPKFLLKISKFIVNDGMVIGAIVNAVNIQKIESSELFFFKPISLKVATNEIDRHKQSLSSILKKVNPRQILSFPFDSKMLHNPDDAFVEWYLHPLKSLPKESAKCNKDMKTHLDVGWYSSELYSLVVRYIIDKWNETRIKELDDLITKFIKSNPDLPISNIKIDQLLEKIIKDHPEYDPSVTRVIIMGLFDQINSTDKNVDQAIVRLQKFEPLNGFDLKNIHRLTRKEVEKKVLDMITKHTTKTKSYPEFELNTSIQDQRYKFFKNEKILVHEDLWKDILDTFVSDLMNPFRRDYVINQPLTESALTYIQPHIGELIYVYKINL